MKLRVFVHQEEPGGAIYCAGAAPDHTVDHLDLESWEDFKDRTISQFFPDWKEYGEVREFDIEIPDEPLQKLFKIETIEITVAPE